MAALAPIFLTATGAGVFTIPAGWTSAVFEVIGGGGGSGNGAGFATGGGGGAYSETTVNVSPGVNCNYNVGVGGPPGFSNSGGDSWIALNNTATVITSPGVICGAKGGTTGALSAVTVPTGQGGQ